VVANAVQEDGITSRHLAFFFPPGRPPLALCAICVSSMKMALGG